jgi:hypothetical protein
VAESHDSSAHENGTASIHYNGISATPNRRRSVFGTVQNLNVSVAASIAMNEYVRQHERAAS